MINPMGWVYEEEIPNLVDIKGKGAGSIDGTLRQFGVFVRATIILSRPSFPHLLLLHHLSVSDTKCGRYNDRWIWTTLAVCTEY